MSESEMKVTANGANVFAAPLPDFSKIAIAGFGSEQVAERTRQGLEKLKAASDEISEALRETYSSNTRSATDYGLKVLELSNANAASALDFMIHLCSSKSPTDVLTLSAEQTRKAFVTASDQNRELWTLAQKLATETGEPIRKRFSKVVFHQTG